MSWSERRLAEEFQTTRWMAKKAKELVSEFGVMTSPNQKLGVKLSEETINLVQEFYNSDLNCRILPGTKDFVSVKQLDGSRIHIQKKLVLCNLKELFALFKEKYPEVVLGFSRFAGLRPKHCVLAGSSGTHTVCVCIVHENTKLMLDALKLSNFKTIKDVLKYTVCENYSKECFWDSCKDCPGRQ